MSARLWSTLLIDDVYFLSLGLAAMVFIAIQYLTRSGWWVVLRRVPEAMAGGAPVASAILLSLYFGRADLYPWSRPGAAESDPLVAAKSAYLNTPFFFLRLILFVGIWTLFALAFRKLARTQEEEPRDSPRAHRSLTRLSAAFLPIFAVTFALASFDWLMSVDPHWYSTIFGVYSFAGLFQAGIAAITLLVLALRAQGALAHAVRESHLHDLGKLLFAFSVFWAYIWVSQYLLIWYSDLPEEVTYYVARTSGPWAPWFFGAFALNFGVPFFVLVARAPKRDPRILAVVASLVLVGRWLDLYVQVGPPVVGVPRLGVPEIGITLAFALLFVALCRRALTRATLLPARDPYLAESLAHHA